MVISAPAVVMSVILGLNVTFTCLLIGIPTTIFTMFGGVRAIAYTDFKQMFAVVASLIIAVTVLILGLPDSVGVGDALRIAGTTGRLQMFDFRLDFTEQYTFWSGTIAALFLFLSYFGTDQSQVQRYLSAKSEDEARSSLLMSAFWKIPLQALVLIVGVLTFTFYLFTQPPMLFNPVHDGLVVRHPGEEDEESKPGEHAAHRIRPPHLTAELARVRRDRATTARPSRAHRVYTYSGLLACVTCGSKLWGSTTAKGGRRMTHPVVKCADPSYHVVSKWDAEVEEKVVAAIALPPTWRARVMGLMQRTTGDADLSSRRSKLEKIRSLYKVDDDYDERSYLRDRKRIQTELAALGEPEAPRDLEEAARILGDFPRVWRGSSETTRRALLTTIFEAMGIKRDKIVSVTPREQYLELVTVATFEGLLSGGVYQGRGERT